MVKFLGYFLCFVFGVVIVQVSLYCVGVYDKAPVGVTVEAPKVEIPIYSTCPQTSAQPLSLITLKEGEVKGRFIVHFPSSGIDYLANWNEAEEGRIKIKWTRCLNDAK